MVWVLYPNAFEKGVHMPRQKGWIERQNDEKQYLENLSKLIREESSRTPGESIIISANLGPLFLVFVQWATG